ncbi:pro-FMRFamide-related neuropeptide VF [Ambystoma mexicanum]|uniref:pro-FMRFamide-related neuropeptide VF n=1 Tax=Ambystoma mexicanum TaxID=8296 RepID=UPI0037E7371C
MEMVSLSRLMVFTLSAFIVLAAQILGLDDAARSQLYGQEGDQENFSESNEDIFEETQRGVNSGEDKDGGVKSIIKMSVPWISRMPQAAANLPLRFGRSFLDERNINAAAYLPLRYARAFEERIPKSVPNLPQRFGRYLSSKRAIQPLANLPQRFGRAPSVGKFMPSLANLPQRFGRSMSLQKLGNLIFSRPLESQESGYSENRMLDLDNATDEEAKEGAANPNNWNQNHNPMLM